MMQDPVKDLIYVGYYDCDSNAAENRNYVLAARSKMDYVISAARRAGRSVLVVSASQTFNRRGYRGRIVPLAAGLRVRLFRTLPWGGRVRRVLSRTQMGMALLAWLLINTGRDDEVLVYHSVAYSSVIQLAHRVRGFRLILEVEEVYANVSGNKADYRREMNLFRRADAFIFPTARMSRTVNPQGRRSAVAHGAYAIEAPQSSTFGDDRIHVVYAGTFDPRKGGAQTAIASAMCLDHRYHLHIIGSGNHDEVAAVRLRVDEVSSRVQCAVTFDGTKTGEEYARFLQACHIGLSTQRPDSSYCDTSFPSKILSYMANGLHVVSIRIPVVEESAVGDLVHYYEEDDGESVATAIMGVDLSAPYDSRARIRELDNHFVRELSRLLSSSPD